MVSHAAGPVPIHAIPSHLMRSGPSGGEKPSALPSAAALTALRAITVANPKPDRSSTINELATDARSFRIDENGIADFNLDVGPAHGIVDDDALADTSWAALQQSKADRVTKGRREGYGGDVTLIVGRYRLSTARYQMPTRAQPFAAEWANADERWTILIRQARPSSHDAAYEILFRRHHPAHPEIAGGGLTAELVACGVTFLDPHHAERFGAIGDGVEVFSDFEECPDQRVAMRRRDADLKGEFTRK